VERLAIALLLTVVAGSAALILRRRRPDPPSTPAATVPAQLDRRDFTAADVEWLIVVFTAASCLSCLSVWHRARNLESPSVAVSQVEAKAQVGLHKRYGIDSVPLTLAADRRGVVRASVLGPLGATDLAALTELLRN
jgi:hypothetical protein